MAGYHADDSVVVGFAHTHVSGAERGELSDILVMPGVVPSTDVPDLRGPWEAPLDRPFADLYRDVSEEAEPGYYRVELERSGIGVELTATTRTGLHRYTFPDNVPTALLVDLGYSASRDRTVAADLRLVSDTLLVGTRHSTGWADDRRVHFAAAFSSPVTDAIFFAEPRAQ